MKQLVFSLLLIITAGIFASDAVAQQATTETRKPNIILIMADDLGFADIGCYGSEIETPTLDALAADGLRFTQFYNTAKCHSSRVSLMTGLYPPGHGVWANGMALPRRGNEHIDPKAKWPLPPESIIPEIPTSADRFAEAGYRTASFGKLHLTPNLGHPAYGYEETFGAWRVGEMDDWHGPYYGFQHVEMTKGHGEGPALRGHYSVWLRENAPEVYERVRAHERAKTPQGVAPVYQSVIPSELHHSRWLAERGAGTIIAGGMGQRAQSLFSEHGIQVVIGAPAEPPEALVAAYLDGSLATGDNVCDH